MNVIEAMKAFGLNAKGAQKKLNEMAVAEESANPADTTNSADSASDKWSLIAEKLNSYTGRFTKEGYPYTQDLEQCIEMDITPEQTQKIWDKYTQEKGNE